MTVGVTSQLVRPLPCTVLHEQNVDFGILHTICDYIGRPGDHEFPGTIDLTTPAYERVR